MAKGRRVRRIVRRIDPWTVLKVSLIFLACFLVVLLVAGGIIYNVSRAAGVMAKVEGIAQKGGFENFRFRGDKLLLASFLIGMVLVVVLTAVNVLMAFLYNLISDLVGGIEITVIEEEPERIKAKV